jgi:6,7-dimethyl-8-ribityllumazine synthase
MAGFGDPHLTTVEAQGLRLGIVGSRWHATLVDHMVERAEAAAKACGVDDVVVVRVAGSVELPVVAQALAKTCDAVVALGVVIRGETYHFEIVSNESARGIMALTMDGIAIGNGILTTENEAQAIYRADPNQADKGGGAARAALAMLELRQRFG